MPTDYTTQFAIQNPDGTLWSQPDHAAMAYAYMGVEAKQPPTVFNTKADAEYVLGKLRMAAAQIGVGHWAGVIVTRYCTPFSSVDPAEHLVGELQSWMETRGNHEL